MYFTMICDFFGTNVFSFISIPSMSYTFSVSVNICCVICYRCNDISKYSYDASNKDDVVN